MKRYILLLVISLFVGGEWLWGQSPLKLSVEQCKELALEYNQDIKKSAADVEKAQLDKSIAVIANLPKLEGSVSGVYLNDMDMMGSTLQMKGMYMAGFSVTQPIYAGGQISISNKLANIGKESAVEMYRDTKMSVIEQAQNGYWSLVAVNKKVDMLISYKSQLEALYSQIKLYVDVKMATNADMQRVKAKLTEIDYQLQKCKNGAALCAMSLCGIMGISLDTAIEPVDTILTVEPLNEFSSDLSARPQMRLLEYQLEAKDKQVALAKGEFLPSAGLSAGYSYYGNVKIKGVAQDPQSGATIPYTQDINGGITMVMASLKIPIFHWGEGSKKIRKARIDYKNAQLDLEKNRNLMQIEVNSCIRNMQDGYRMVVTAENSLIEAEENLRIMENYYKNQMATLTDYLDAQSQWQQAKSNLIEAQTQYKIYELQYKKSIGILE